MNNFCYKELIKFSSHASSWWNIRKSMRMLHQINPLRLEYIVDNIKNGINKKKIVDIGCGGGILSESMALLGAKVTGLDVCAKLLKIANLHAIKNNIKVKYLLETAENHVKKFNNYYDVVTCMETLEHVPNPQSLVNTCYKLVKPNGDIFISTINKNFKSYFFAIICAEYILNMLPLGTHNFKNFISPSKLLHWMDKNNFSKINIIGINYNLFSKKFFLSKNIDINYILHVRRTY